MNAGALSLALVSLVAVTAPAQIASLPDQPRDARPQAQARGTASIRGRVYNAETGAPIRRAYVMLMPVGGVAASAGPRAGGGVPPPPGGGAPVSGDGRGAAMPPERAVPFAGGPLMAPPRTTGTDAAGRFEFSELPAGSYRLRVMPGPYSAQYVGTMYGGSGAMDQGTAIELKGGQRFQQAEIPLVRGGAINGRVVDEAGEPLTRVMVYASRLVPGTSRFVRVGGGLMQSDDYGRYRIYGLEAGEYVVTAEARSMGGPPVDDGESEAFVTTYHPSVPSQGEAARIRVRAGADVDGIDVQMIRTRAYRITGTIMDSQGRMVARPNAMLAKTSADGGFSSHGVSVDPEGRFRIRDVAPGDYTLVVRPAFGEGGSEASKAPPEYAAVPLSVSGDIDDLVVITQPGVSIAGQVVFVDGEPEGGGTIRINTQPGNRLPMFGPSPGATVGADRRFMLENLAGPVLIRAALQRDWAVKAVMLGTADVTDTPVEFRKEHSGHLQVLVATRTSALEGVVTGDDGKPAEGANVLVFPEDSASWRFGSPRVRMTATGKDGNYIVSGLLGGRYHAVALPYRTLGLTPDVTQEYFQNLTRDATQVVLSDDERRVVDLRLAAPRER